jgi:DNA polymerase/3'-5' exonuclease PolX
MSALTLESPAEKPKFARADALEVARKFVRFLKPHCDRLIVAGSLRRRRNLEVSDVEILFIPKFSSLPDPNDLFGEKIRTNAAERAIAALLEAGVLMKRPKCDGTLTWGEKNKLGVHVESGIPVDLFSATCENWFNYVVCRTGPAESNVRICNAAIARGWQWNPYGSGFTRKPSGAGPGYHDVAPMCSERQVFTFVGLPYLEPWERV